MLACIRAWQLVMSPPTLPHSSITSHLLPNTSWGTEGGTDTETRRLYCPSTQTKTIHHNNNRYVIKVMLVQFSFDDMWSGGRTLQYRMSALTGRQSLNMSTSYDPEQIIFLIIEDTEKILYNTIIAHSGISCWVQFSSVCWMSFGFGLLVCLLLKNNFITHTQINQSVNWKK